MRQRAGAVHRARGGPRRVLVVGLPLFLAAWYGVADDAQVLREWLDSQRHSGQIAA